MRQDHRAVIPSSSVPNNNNNNNTGAIAQNSKPHSQRKGTELASHNSPDQLNSPSDSSPLLALKIPFSRLNSPSRKGFSGVRRTLTGRADTERKAVFPCHLDGRAGQVSAEFRGRNSEIQTTQKRLLWALQVSRPSQVEQAKVPPNFFFFF